jgi:hypothetical protein
MLALVIFTGDKICRLVGTGSPASVVGIATRLLAELSGVRNFSIPQKFRPALRPTLASVLGVQGCIPAGKDIHTPSSIADVNNVWI